MKIIITCLVAFAFFSSPVDAQKTYHLLPSAIHYQGVGWYGSELKLLQLEEIQADLDKAQQTRIWSSRDGSYRIEAKLVDYGTRTGTLTLLSTDGEFKVQRSSLCKEDLSFARQYKDAFEKKQRFEYDYKLPIEALIADFRLKRAVVRLKENKRRQAEIEARQTWDVNWEQDFRQRAERGQLDIKSVMSLIDEWLKLIPTERSDEAVAQIVIMKKIILIQAQFGEANLSNYKKVSTGMNEIEVVFLLGEPNGGIESDSEFGSGRYRIKTKLRTWEDGRGGFCDITFQNGIVVLKAQSGMR